MNWLADRMRLFDASGIRRVFELGAKLAHPINLSIGQPDFDVPEPVRQAALQAIQSRKNTYALSQGLPELREKLQAQIQSEYGHPDRDVFITCGTSGGLVLAMMAVVNPGDEVIVFDPYFVMYEVLPKLMGGQVVYVDTYPDFRVDVDRLRRAITPRTKAIIWNSPTNPTGVMATEEEVRDVAELASKHNILLISDEIYRAFCYDRPFVSPARFNPDTLVLDAFSKSHGMPGWRVGFAHGPRPLIQEMIKLQQYTFVCAPHPFQWAAVTALDIAPSEQIAHYRRKRDRIVEGLKDFYEMVPPTGAFYAFPKVPWGTDREFVEEAIREYQLLIIPGRVFSRRATHFRLSFAASDEILERGIEALQRLARRR
jgi:aspartate/methionine/tyrosine aminotransferase